MATPRASNLSHARRFAAGDAALACGLPPQRDWSPDEVLAVMAERVGIDPDPERTSGADTIDPALTIRALARMRARLTEAMGRGEPVLLASGHPAGVMEVHLALARALRTAGCRILLPAVGHALDAAAHGDAAGSELRYLGGVGVLTDGRSLCHTHSPAGMEAALLALTEQGLSAPGLVIADHGFAGAAAAAGLSVVCFADTNDPALFVGEAEGRVEVAVPIDDNCEPSRYRPVVDYLAAR